MIIWLIEVPIVLLVAVGLLLIVGAKLVASALLTAGMYAMAGMMMVGVLMLMGAFVLFWVTVVMQHYNDAKTNAYDKIMKWVGIRGVILSAVGFLAYVALNSAVMSL